MLLTRRDKYGMHNEGKIFHCFIHFMRKGGWYYPITLSQDGFRKMGEKQMCSQPMRRTWLRFWEEGIPYSGQENKEVSLISISSWSDPVITWCHILFDTHFFSCFTSAHESPAFIQPQEKSHKHTLRNVPIEKCIYLHTYVWTVNSNKIIAAP